MSAGFEAALSAIEPTTADVDAASTAHLDIRAVLESDDVLTEWGIDSVLIGSYKRQVSIRRIKDVDVFCRMKNFPSNVTGRNALDEFSRVLTTEYGSGAVALQTRSLKVELPGWNGLHVDLVPARPSGNYWQIPDRKDPSSGWQETNPEALTQCSTDMNAAMHELYVRCVKLIRQTRRTILGDHPGGLFSEMALYQACRDGIAAGSNIREFYIAALRGVATVIERKVHSGIEIEDPTRPGEFLTFNARDDEWEQAVSAFASAADDAERARTSARCQAEAVFHRLLGKNSANEWVYPLPADCNSDGTSKSRVIAGDRSVAGGDQKFA